MFASQVQELRLYPETRWAQLAPGRWLSLCDGLEHYHAPERSLVLDHEHKWELASALQKAMRRGDKQMVLRLISAVDSLPSECAYFWKRICTTCCEDVGPVDDQLASFVVAGASVFTPKKTGEKTYDVLCYLAEQMCDLPARSRIYCSCSIIEQAANDSELPELSEQDRSIVAAILEQRGEVQKAQNPWLAWQKKQDWRGEDMVAFLGFRLPLGMTKVATPVPSFRVLFDLPNYCYDMHCRVGLKVLHRLVQGAPGAGEIRNFFRQHPVKTPHRVLGEALFFVEGGRIKNELIYEPLTCLEQRVFAHKNGLSLDAWFELQALTAEALQEGIIDRVRDEALQGYAQMSLALS